MKTVDTTMLFADSIPSPAPIPCIIERYPDLDDLNHEEVINIELVAVELGDGENEIALRNTHLRLNSPSVNQLIDAIPIGAFTKLFDVATKLHIPGTDYVTGLKINFGIDNDKIVAIYQPLNMKQIFPDPPEYYNFDIQEGKEYIFNGTCFELATEEQIGWKKNYTDNIMVLHTGESQYSDFKPGIDSESVIFPFQTIFSLIYYNEGIITVNLHNAIRTDKKTGEIHHCILLSQGLPNKLREDLTGKYANRSHLCPPNCKKLYYSLF